MKEKTSVFVFMLVMSLAGCGGGSSVSGKVRFEDGSPLTVGVVQFVNETGSYAGRIGSDGSFRVTGDTEKKGIPNGNYSVAVVRAFEAIPDRESDGYGTVRNLIDKKYSQAQTSGLSCTVQGKTDFNISVTKPAE